MWDKEGVEKPLWHEVLSGIAIGARGREGEIHFSDHTTDPVLDNVTSSMPAKGLRRRRSRVPERNL